VLPRDLRDETHSAGSLDPARRDTDDAHPLGTHFLGQRLAVVRQGRFRRRVGDRRLGQRHPILYRGDVDDYAGAPFDHGRYQRADHPLPHALGATGHKRSLSFQVEIAAHDWISSAAILPPSSVKTKSSAIGLPGKSPVSFVRTTVLPSRATTATGSTVCRYFF